MEYKYDVFLSYKNHDVTNDWVVEFERKFRYWLSNEIAERDAEIFFDRDAIENGVIWPDKLRDAIKTSKCILCIWTPQYFRSQWCWKEWKSFEAREKQLNLNKVGTYKIIHAVRFHDGINYPLEAQNRQSLDLSEYAFGNRSFWESHKGTELESLIKKLCAEVAKSLSKSPPFEDFPLLDESNVGEVLLTQRIKI